MPAEQVAEYAGQDLVVFEYLFVDGEQEPVAEHADPEDEAQTFTVAEEEPGAEPSIGTTVAVDGSDEKVLPLTGGTVIDTVAYTGLTPGEDYLLTGEIRTSPDGERSEERRVGKACTPGGAQGPTTEEVVISAEDIAAQARQERVGFEYLC